MRRRTQRGKVLRLIQIRLATPSAEKLGKLGKKKLTTSRSTSNSRTNALEHLQIFEQFLFVLVRQLCAVGVTLITVSFFSRIEKEVRLG